MDQRDLEDLARGEFEASMAFGVSFDNFNRLAKAVREQCARDAESCDIGPCPNVATQRAATAAAIRGS